MYIIKIEKSGLEMQPPSQSYEKIGETKGEDGLMSPKYGYVTKPATEKEVARVVYQQMVDSLDIVAVVGAINGTTFTGYKEK